MSQRQTPHRRVLRLVVAAALALTAAAVVQPAPAGALSSGCAILNFTGSGIGLNFNGTGSAVIPDGVVSGAPTLAGTQFVPGDTVTFTFSDATTDQATATFTVNDRILFQGTDAGTSNGTLSHTFVSTTAVSSAAIVLEGNPLSGGIERNYRANCTNAGPTFTGAADATTVVSDLSGGPLSYEVPTASDENGLAGPVTCDPAVGEPVGLGPTTVTCSATDGSGSVSSVQFTVRLVFLTIATVPDQAVDAAAGASSAVVTFPSPAAEGSDGPVATTCAPASGSAFPVGSTLVTCLATDQGATVASTFTVTVRTGTPQPTTPQVTTPQPTAPQVTATLVVAPPPVAPATPTTAAAPGTTTTAAARVAPAAPPVQELPATGSSPLPLVAGALAALGGAGLLALRRTAGRAAPDSQG